MTKLIITNTSIFREFNQDKISPTSMYHTEIAAEMDENGVGLVSTEAIGLHFRLINFPKEYCHIEDGKLAELLNISVKTLNKTFGELEKYGYLKRLTFKNSKNQKICFCVVYDTSDHNLFNKGEEIKRIIKETIQEYENQFGEKLIKVAEN